MQLYFILLLNEMRARVYLSLYVKSMSTYGSPMELIQVPPAPGVQVVKSLLSDQFIARPKANIVQVPPYMVSGN
jgi:hypothetical protein